MLFSNSISTLPGNLSLMNTSIDLIVESTTFLGLFIDNKLSWKNILHIYVNYCLEILVL